MKILSLRQWRLDCFWPYTPLQGSAVETGTLHGGLLGAIDARVPGSVYADLLAAGWIEDPYYEMNSLRCEWVKDRWWVYQTAFRLDQSLRDKHVRLIFRGIDYHAHIFLNGEKIGEHEGMHIPCVLEITQKARFGSEENTLKVVLEHAPDEMGQIGYTSATHTLKSRYSYKWDFGTRMVQLGLYDEAYVDVCGGVRIEDTAFSYADKTASATLHASGEGSVRGVLRYRGESVGEAEGALKNGCAELRFPLKNPRLWYPNGEGEQPLYELTLTAFDASGLSDEKKLRVGLRTLEYRRANGAGEESQPYLPVINGRRVYIKGFNFTPADLMVGAADEARYRMLLRRVRDANANLLRVWGGGLIEKEIFYDLCDEYGIMVWQEFPQSSSGLDNVPSKDPHFIALLAQAAGNAILEKRSHVSLTFWSGGNELMRSDGVPADFDDPNLAMLRELTDRFDTGRLMLPTSASGPTEWLDEAHPERNHDVHGPWKYMGPEEHYRLYNHSTIQLHSEFGVDGVSNLEALRTILSPRNRRPLRVSESPVWRHHGEWWCTLDRDEAIFGKIDTLEEYVLLSQYIQAEGVRYALESNRRRAYRCCGSIVWQLNEVWPNTSCTSVLDYYGNPKLVYDFCRDAYRRVHVSLRYDKLIWQPDEVFFGEVFAHLEDGEKPDSIRVRLLDAGGRTLFEKQDSRPFDFSMAVAVLGRSFTAECTLRAGGQTAVSRYLFFVTDEKHPYADREAVFRYVREASGQTE